MGRSLHYMVHSLYYSLKFYVCLIINKLEKRTQPWVMKKYGEERQEAFPFLKTKSHKENGRGKVSSWLDGHTIEPWLLGTSGQNLGLIQHGAHLLKPNSSHSWRDRTPSWKPWQFSFNLHIQQLRQRLKPAHSPRCSTLDSHPHLLLCLGTHWLIHYKPI